jgi:hypothetical protein
MIVLVDGKKSIKENILSQAFTTLLGNPHHPRIDWLQEWMYTGTVATSQDMPI